MAKTGNFLSVSYTDLDHTWDNQAPLLFQVATALCIAQAHYCHKIDRLVCDVLAYSFGSFPYLRLAAV